MKKELYEKPLVEVEELQNETCLLQATGTPPESAPEYDDWLGVRQYNGEWDDDD